MSLDLSKTRVSDVADAYHDFSKAKSDVREMLNRIAVMNAMAASFTAIPLDHGVHEALNSARRSLDFLHLHLVSIAADTRRALVDKYES